jgi:hypothetical protein
MEPYEPLHLADLPGDVRELVLSAVRTLMERGPHGLVVDGLCPAEAEHVLVGNMSAYPQPLVELPDSAQFFGHPDSADVWKIDLPLHDREGEMDLFLFLEVDPKSRSIKVTGLHTP